MDIYYLNHNNQKLDLMKLPYLLQTGDLYNHEWNYEYADNIGQAGGKITKFHMGIIEKNLVLSIMANSEADYYDALNDFFEITEVDILTKNPGKLYVNGQYLTCYLRKSELSGWEGESNFCDNELVLVTEYPFWCIENIYSFAIQSVISSDNKRYAGRYAYRYANGLTNKTITNEHFYSSDMRLIIYGPVTNPSVVIGANTYQVAAILTAGEYIVIDTANKMITKVQSTGNEVNMFNYRNKVYDNFAKIEAGVNNVFWPGNFAFDITIYEERSEPKWIL